MSDIFPITLGKLTKWDGLSTTIQPFSGNHVIMDVNTMAEAPVPDGLWTDGYRNYTRSPIFDFYLVYTPHFT